MLVEKPLGLVQTGHKRRSLGKTRCQVKVKKPEVTLSTGEKSKVWVGGCWGKGGLSVEEYLTTDST